jgi:K+-sensing histidine kinase KdpD
MMTQSSDPSPRFSNKEAWKQADKVISNLIATFSCEFRTPLIAIQAFSEFLLSGKAGSLNDQQIKYLTFLHENAVELMDDFNHFFDMHRATIGQLPLKFEEIELYSLIQSVSPEHLSLDFPPDLPIVQADKQRLKQAIVGLVSEVVHSHYPPTDSQITIKCRLELNHLVTKIIASGDVATSFPDDYPNPTLFYSYIVIEQHGGDLKVEKSAETLEVTIWLPITQDQSFV